MDTRPDHIADLIRQGRKLEAIRLLREETGVGLKEAADAVERIGAGLDPLAGAPPTRAPLPIDADIAAHARAGRRIEAIKLLRERTGLGLKEAKDAVDAIPGVPPTPGCASLAVAVAVAILLVAVGVAVAVFLGASG